MTIRASHAFLALFLAALLSAVAFAAFDVSWWTPIDVDTGAGALRSLLLIAGHSIAMLMGFFGWVDYVAPQVHTFDVTVPLPDVRKRRSKS